MPQPLHGEALEGRWPKADPLTAHGRARRIVELLSALDGGPSRAAISMTGSARRAAASAPWSGRLLLYDDARQLVVVVGATA